MGEREEARIRAACDEQAPVRRTTVIQNPLENFAVDGDSIGAGPRQPFIWPYRVIFPAGLAMHAGETELVFGLGHGIALRMR